MILFVVHLGLNCQGYKHYGNTTTIIVVILLLQVTLSTCTCTSDKTGPVMTCQVSTHLVRQNLLCGSVEDVEDVSADETEST